MFARGSPGGGSLDLESQVDHLGPVAATVRGTRLLSQRLVIDVGAGALRPDARLCRGATEFELFPADDAGVDCHVPPGNTITYSPRQYFTAVQARQEPSPTASHGCSDLLRSGLYVPEAASTSPAWTASSSEVREGALQVLRGGGDAEVPREYPGLCQAGRGSASRRWEQGARP